jgi:hypothetical protein
VLLLVAVKLDHVEIEFAQMLIDVVAIRIDEDSDNNCSPADRMADFARTVDCQIARARRIKVDADHFGAERNRGFGILDACDATDFDADAHLNSGPDKLRAEVAPSPRLSASSGIARGRFAESTGQGRQYFLRPAAAQQAFAD